MPEGAAMEEHEVGSLTESSTAEPGSTKEFDNQMPSRATIVPQTPAQKSPQSSDDQVLTTSQPQ
jgi:hypothetical protein